MNIYKNKVYLLILFIFLGWNTAEGQDEKLISIKKINKDFDMLKAIISAHPDPFTHIPEEEFNQQYNDIKSSLDHEHDMLEFYKKASSLVALIKDGHSSVHLPEHWFKNHVKKVGLFPYEVFLSNDDELVVIKDLNQGKIPEGAKITSINGIPIDEFIQRIDPYIAYEKTHFRNTLIDDFFDKYLWLAFGHRTEHEIEYYYTDTSRINVPNMSYKKWMVYQDEKEIPYSKDKPYDYQKLAGGVGIIKIYAFHTSDINTYNSFLTQTFKSIKKDGIHSLVIDVRDNLGGWPKISSKLFHYISNHHFKTSGKSNLKISEVYRENILEQMPQLRENPLLAPVRRHYVDIGSILNKPLGSYVEEEIFFNEKPINKKFEFQGDCYLLTNRDSYSAASSFASTFQCYNMGTIIGEETGGTKIFRANAIYEKLNKTGLRVSMSTTKIYTTCYNEELEGVSPHIKYTPTVLDLVSGMDTQLIYTQRIIKQIRRKRQKNNG